MIEYYKMTKSGVNSSGKEEANWLNLQNLSEEELIKVTDQYDLPLDLFAGIDEPEEVSRVERIHSEKLTNVYSLIVLNLSAETERSIEARLHPISFVKADGLLITYSSRESDFIHSVIEKYRQEFNSFEKVISYSLLSIYNHYLMELEEIKKRIDKLDQSARNTTENEELFKLADTTRDIVYIDHTLRDQDETLNYLMEHTDFQNKIGDKELLYEVRLRHRQVNKLIEIYRDLLETVGGLFTDMMDNNLNHLMKYLDSAALVISIPALISGIWGMNTGGLPGAKSNLAFFVVLVLSIILAAIAAVYLHRKDYSK
ncbi:magnesium transporter CorA family protein [Enterococcus mediterraneensis]|uniref:magnesium transporter CorA family protein n=1 Tax=Enterococcus mediterraneensis TaxID=2364791 RepID=UPI000F05CC70|nr:magnesium transporter CorA family protein [Enterococcus mediterraneensis]